MVWENNAVELLEADVIKWTEAVWPPSTYRRKRRFPWGQQMVTGQITKIEGDLVSLLILKAHITENNFRSELLPHRVGSTVRKKQQTLLKSKPERLYWSEEEVRAVILAEHHQAESLVDYRTD